MDAVGDAGQGVDGASRPTHKAVVIKGLTLLWTKDDGSITDVHIYFDVAVAKASSGSDRRSSSRCPAHRQPPGPPQVYEQAGTPDEKTSVRSRGRRSTPSRTTTRRPTSTRRPTTRSLHARARAARARARTPRGRTSRRCDKSIGQLDTTIDNDVGHRTVRGPRVLDRGRAARAHRLDPRCSATGSSASTWRRSTRSATARSRACGATTTRRRSSARRRGRAGRRLRRATMLRLARRIRDRLAIGKSCVRSPALRSSQPH